MKKLLLITGCALLAATAVHAADATVYTDSVEKILKASCISCHRSDKKKGKLDLSTYESLLKGGRSQAKGKPTVKAGNADESLMIKLICLPKDDEDHMPPSDSKAHQVTDKDLALLKWWITDGAKKDTKLADAKLPEDIKATAEALSKKQIAPPPPSKSGDTDAHANKSKHEEEEDDDDDE